MPTLRPLLLLFGAWALVGGLRAFRLLTVHRRTARDVHTLFEWSERPLSSWRYEPYSAVAILLHILAISVLSVAALRAATKPPTFVNSLVPADTTTAILLWIAEGGSISLVGYLLGSLVAFPLAQLRKTPIAFAITEEGMAHGRTLLPWRWFSHFTIDHNEGILRLYSAFSPDLPSLVSKPSASAPLVEISETLQSFMPGQPVSASRAWYRTKLFLIPTVILICLPLVAAGWLAARLPRELALFGVALSSVVLTLLGGRVITLFAFGIFRIGLETSRLPPDA